MRFNSIIGGLIVIGILGILGIGVAGNKDKANKPQDIKYEYPTGNEQH